MKPTKSLALQDPSKQIKSTEPLQFIEANSVSDKVDFIVFLLTILSPDFDLPKSYRILQFIDASSKKKIFFP
jgi:hypothetical protein